MHDPTGPRRAVCGQAAIQIDRHIEPDSSYNGSILRRCPTRTYASMLVVTEDGEVWCLRAELDGEYAMLAMIPAPEEP